MTLLFLLYAQTPTRSCLLQHALCRGGTWSLSTAPQREETWNNSAGSLSHPTICPHLCPFPTSSPQTAQEQGDKLAPLTLCCAHPWPSTSLWHRTVDAGHGAGDGAGKGAGCPWVLGGMAVLRWPRGDLPHSWLEKQGQCLTNRNLPRLQSWGNLLELVYNHHPDALPCLQDLLQPMDVIGIGVSERDIVWQPGNLHSVRTVPDEFIGHHDRPVQAQSLSCNGRAEDNMPALPHRASDPNN